jgi:hypothetical protein
MMPRFVSAFALFLTAGCAFADSLRWNAAERRFDLAGATGGRWLTGGRMCVGLVGGSRLCSDDARYRAAAAGTTLRFTDERAQLDLVLTAGTAYKGAITLQATITNRGAQPLALDRIDLLIGHLTDPRDPNKTGMLLSNMTMGERRETGKNGAVESYYTLAVESPALAAGFLTGWRNTNRFTFTPGADLTAWGECNGAQLPAGQSRVTDTLFLAARGNPLAEMERFADLAAQINRARVWPTNFAAWCNWYAGWILERAGTFRQGLEKGVEQNIEPVRQFHLGRDQTASYAIRICDDMSYYGDWTDTPKNVPNGLTRLARMIREAGLVPGVWYVPYWVLPDSKLAAAHPEWMGRNLDGSIYRTATGSRYSAKGFTILDTSHPEVVKHFESLGRRWRDRGFRYVTTDFLTNGLRPPKHYDPTKTKAEVFRMGMEATRRGLGDEVYYRTISALYGPSMGLSNDMRVGADSFGDVVSAYEIVGSLWFYNRRLWINDPESIVLRERDAMEKTIVPDAFKGHRTAEAEAGEFKSEQWTTMWASWIALSGTVMTYGDRLAELPPRQMSLYNRAFPPLNISGRPLDIWENKPFYLWGMSPADADGPYQLFGAFELGGRGAGNLSLNLDEISARCRGWNKPASAPAEYLVWSFWDRKLAPSKGWELTIPTPSKSGTLFSLRPRLARPQLLATSGHFSQGMLETNGIRWDARTATLSGKARGTGFLATTLYFHVPAGMKLKEAKIGPGAAQTGEAGPGVIALEVPGNKEFAPFSLAFQGTAAKPAQRAFHRGRAATKN